MLCSRTTNKATPPAQLHEKVKGHVYFWGILLLGFHLIGVVFGGDQLTCADSVEVIYPRVRHLVIND